ncbi:ParB/RepB/Spo0J family partition protein [Streptomyces sp. NPDC021622]|uniref:ParB/RepB/Spo0J family partition protein n=1 Tax=Streptomyces sp. NPDC021622 TaxID=3155013 RepID=UPI0033E28657
MCDQDVGCAWPRLAGWMPQGGPYADSSDIVKVACRKVPIGWLLPADSPRTKGVDQEYVAALSELGEELPPIVVHEASGRVIDGMHRLAAARLRGEEMIHAHLVEAPEHKLFEVSVRLNSAHGKPLSYREKVAAGTRILMENQKLSDRYVASLTGLSPRTIARLRRSSGEVAHLNARIGLDGKVRRVGVAPGRQRASELLAERPGAPLREIAREAGISLGTAHDVKKRVLLGEDPVPRRSEKAPAPVAKSMNLLTEPESPTPIAGVAQPLQKLRRDPALRLSESGRLLLRHLAIHDVDSQVLADVAANLPPHTTDRVAQLARECAEKWARFAERVERESSVGRRTPA